MQVTNPRQGKAQLCTRGWALRQLPAPCIAFPHLELRAVNNVSMKGIFLHWATTAITWAVYQPKHSPWGNKVEMSPRTHCSSLFPELLNPQH